MGAFLYNENKYILRSLNYLAFIRHMLYSVAVSPGKMLMTSFKHLMLGHQKEMHYPFSKLHGSYYSFIAQMISR